MNKRNILPILEFMTATLITTVAANAIAMEKQKGHCRLTNGGIVDIQGLCEFFQTGSNVNVQGKAEENGVTFLAEIDNSKNEGLLLGAGTFDLAKGKLSKNDPLEVSWPNG